MESIVIFIISIVVVGIVIWGIYKLLSARNEKRRIEEQKIYEKRKIEEQYETAQVNEKILTEKLNSLIARCDSSAKPEDYLRDWDTKYGKDYD